MRNTLIIATGLIVFCSLSAQAADIAPPFEPYTPLRGTIAPEPASWHGLYFGGQLGYGKVAGEDNLGNPSSTFDGISGGVHVGYNHLFGNFLLGAELQGNLTDFKGTTKSGLNYNSDWILTPRLRAGYIFDQYLAYATVGMSASNVKFENSNRGTEDTNIHTGLLAGGGLEMFVNERISARIEYQYHWFNRQDYDLGGTPFKVDGSTQLVQAGFSYHF